MRKTNEQKGITLIALVITIIVLLILAGVAINLAVDANGLFSRANEAKTEWNNRVDYEQETIQNVLDMANEYIGGNTGGGNTLPTGWDPNKVGSVFTESGTNKQAPIPNGFTASSVAGENTITNGLVIYENTGSGDQSVTEDNRATALTTRNQYVWIPVDDINSMIMCKSNSGNSECVIAPDGDGNLTCTKHNSDDLVGRLYTSTESESQEGSNYTYTYTMDFSKRDQAYDENNFHEPNTTVLDSEDSEEMRQMLAENGIFIEAVNLEEFQNDFYAMAKSVYTYGGFYISRYEIGEGGASKKNQKILTTVSEEVEAETYLGVNHWWGLYKTLRTTVSGMSSHMIWGCQYDQVIKFLGDIAQTGHSSGYQTTGDYPSLSGTTTPMNNIYDLEGNCYEWTAEAFTTNFRATRGDCYQSANFNRFYPASFRHTGGDPTLSNYDLSSRSSLYL